MNSQRGFSLIEALVVGVIATIIPVVTLTVLNLNTTGILETSSRSRLGRVYEAVSQEIRRAADTAGAARIACADNAVVLGVPSGQGVILCDSTFNVTQKGFRVVSQGGGIGRLEEALPGQAWRPFVVGPDTVRVTFSPTTGKATGLFGVGTGPYVPRWQGFYFNLRLRMTISGVLDTLPLQTESIICRNADPWL